MEEPINMCNSRKVNIINDVDVRFALPVYNDKTGELERYNIFSAKMLVRHANNGKKYLYDFLTIKKGPLK